LLGDASYSIYLLHWFLIGIVRGVLLHLHMRFVALPYLLTFAGSIVVGVICYRWVESPMNRYFHVRRRTALAT
jgi:peptidoglycan/LPS O-acetylase OafA/YrhL